MEIILSKSDIEELIKNAYSGVNNVKFNSKNLKITLDVDSNIFFSKPNKPTPTQSTAPIPGKVMSDEEKRLRALKSGTMLGGGAERNIQHLG